VIIKTSPVVNKISTLISVDYLLGGITRLKEGDALIDEGTEHYCGGSLSFCSIVTSETKSPAFLTEIAKPLN
jgi:hypothetical protein